MIGGLLRLSLVKVEKLLHTMVVRVEAINITATLCQCTHQQVAHRRFVLLFLADMPLEEPMLAHYASIPIIEISIIMIGELELVYVSSLKNKDNESTII